MDLSILSPKAREAYETVTAYKSEHPDVRMTDVYRETGVNQSTFNKARQIVDRAGKKAKIVLRKKTTMQTLPVFEEPRLTSLVAFVGSRAEVIAAVREYNR